MGNRYIYILFTVDKVNYCGLKKKKNGKRGEENVDVQTKRSLKKKNRHEQEWYCYRVQTVVPPNK